MIYESFAQNWPIDENPNPENKLQLVEKTREKLVIPTIRDWDSFYEYIDNLGEVKIGSSQIYDAKSFIDCLKRARKNILNNPPDLVKDKEIIKHFDIKADRRKILKNSPYLIEVIDLLGSAESFVIRNVFSTLIMNDLEAIRGNINNVSGIRKKFAMHVLSNETQDLNAN